jgi:hypothetical protein
MPYFYVKATWKVRGTFRILADDLDVAIDAVYSNDSPETNTENASDVHMVDDTFEIDEPECKEVE